MRRSGSSMILVLALCGGMAACAARVRVYDGPHRDYHRWDRHEEASFRVYLNERHMPYHDFQRLNANEQNDYWNWRHDHPDR